MALKGRACHRARVAAPRRGLREVHPCLTLAVTLLACASLFAQQPTSQDANAAGAAEDTSKKVDESEENYRARMELRDQRYREQPRADMIYSSQTGKEKIDQLPEASRQHIKEQLRDMIIASRQWKPGEDVSDYPYEPSVAAQTDAQLRSKEREAWAEQLQKYQQREAAAYADAEGQGNAQAAGQDTGSAVQGAGKAGAKGRTGVNSAAAGQSRAKSAHESESNEEQEREKETVSTAGVSENALRFLQNHGAQNAATHPQAEGASEGEAAQSAAEDSRSPGASPATETPPGSLALNDLAMLQGMMPSADDESHTTSRERQSGSSTSASSAAHTSDDLRSDELSATEDETERLAGTLLIDDLTKLDITATQDQSPAARGTMSGEKANPVAADRVEPGTLDISELKRLEGN